MIHHTYCMNCHAAIHSKGRIFVHDDSDSPYCGVTIVDAHTGDEGIARRMLRSLGFRAMREPHTFIDARYRGSQAVPREWKAGSS